MGVEYDKQAFQPVILGLEYTHDLYRKVTISVRPGRQWSCIVGGREISDDEAIQQALTLMRHINP